MMEISIPGKTVFILKQGPVGSSLKHKSKKADGIYSQTSNISHILVDKYILLITQM